MSKKGDSDNRTTTSVATTGSIIIILIVVMVTVNTTLDYSAPSANGSRSVASTSSTQVSSSTAFTSSTQGSSSTAAPPIIDGQSESIPGYCLPSLTTSRANDVLILFVGAQGSGPLVSVADSAGLTWHHRASAAYNLTTTPETLEEWYATSRAPLSKDNITVKATSAGAFHCFVLGVAGANLASPFDPSVGCRSGTAVPQSFSSGTPAINPTVTICTSNSSDLLVTALWAAGSYPISSVPAGFTFLAGGGINSFNEAYEQVSTSQAGLPVTWMFYGGGDSAGVIGDAITA
jgi:hypothetical protein